MLHKKPLSFSSMSDLSCPICTNWSYPPSTHPLPHLIICCTFETNIFLLSSWFCSLPPPTHGQTFPRINCKATSQAPFKHAPSDSPFSDLVWLPSPRRLTPGEHSVCYMSNRARLKCVCPSYKIARLFLYTPCPTRIQLMLLALGSG